MASALKPSGSTRAWKRLRAAYALTLPRPCWRCGVVIEPSERWHLGHIIDRADGGGDDMLAPEHPRCNMSASATAQAERQRRSRGLEPKPPTDREPPPPPYPGPSRAW